MKRTLVLLAAVLLLTGCASPQDAFVTAVTEQTPQILNRGTAAELKELGANVCDYIDQGLTPEEATDRITELGISPEESEAVVTAAVDNLC